ncbi:DciA family protein [Streptomyces sp. SRF1]|uniref:DciA family protein n=1 Tax=Streptomyces sp. SRF1 TaxID=1549642 RepID=UPI0025B1A9DD|nr:DciA family protein [Streptomyces sp. SRF1]MDN3057053.1 DciA family protein [Streptomyces sp. SRF1]
MTEARNTGGVDLARVALHQAREAAKAHGEAGTRKTKQRTRPSSTRRDGREPTGFAALLQSLMADRAWELPAAGGTVVDRWPEIAATVAERLAEHAQAVAFDAGKGRLDVRADSPAYATQIRLMSAGLTAAANEAVGRDAVRSIRVLAAGAPAPPVSGSSPASSPPVPEAPVRTRETASPGYQQALAAHRASKPERALDPRIAAAIEQQNAGSSMREPEEAFGDGQAAIEELRAKAARATAADSSRVRALRRARAERAGSAAAAAPREARTA